MKHALAILIALAWPTGAHVMSMSSGDLTIEGSRAHYDLRMPLYEIAHVQRPEQVLLDQVKFTGARAVSRECHADPTSDYYICSAEYVFPKPPGEVEVECRLASVTVPNHVHLLRAKLGGRREGAIFDAGFTRTTLRFRDTGAAEAAVTQTVAGFLRALSGPVQVLFLAALVLAARSRSELILMGSTWVAGQCASVAIVPLTAWQPAARFVEAAAALTIAYLAVEMLLLPAAGSRWIVAAALGMIHGLYLLLFVQNTGYHAAFVLAGAAIAQALVLAALWYVATKLGGIAKTWTRAGASALLVFGLTWFFLRLRG
jgi:HupE / UreJ protein